MYQMKKEKNKKLVELTDKIPQQGHRVPLVVSLLYRISYLVVLSALIEPHYYLQTIKNMNNKMHHLAKSLINDLFECKNVIFPPSSKPKLIFCKLNKLDKNKMDVNE